MKAKLSLQVISLFWLVLTVLLFPATALADDCTRDPLNAADCMRTPGFRPAIAVTVGLTGTLTTVLVNILMNQLVGLKPPSTLQPPPGQPPVIVQQPPVQTPPGQPPLVVQQPPVQTPPVQPPPIQQPSVPPPSDAQSPPVSPQEPGWFDRMKQVVDYTGKVYSLFDKYKFTPESIEKWKIASRMWHYFPNEQTAERYIEATRNRMNPGGKWGNRLDIAGKIMDGIDAYNKAQDIIAQRGYTGWEKAGAYYVEGANKVICTILTKNPVVGIVDQVMGDLTGVNIENTIRAGEQKWHDVTKEYAENIYGLDAADAEFASKDQAVRFIKKISQMVKDGKISREEGSRRARKFMKYL